MNKTLYLWQCAKTLEVPVRVIRNWINRGKLPVEKDHLGNTIVAVEDWQAFLAELTPAK